ncbi:hypothetical protein JOC85_000298 [Bacillus mesophilus]|uniref:Small peptidoglycan-associated lipoprotein n=1 Tax=Bacillus mesophilus TaxID=1808955 RepID=A0A6M0Q2Q9_9BACI|nr:hypothetical protein [Bacillus mesophilus]MBM7659531.1 hypothetical protein [Bacillus mesophilus]NEY70403.1 hypothetical protein [Bacillus mesophilus]
MYKVVFLLSSSLLLLTSCQFGNSENDSKLTSLLEADALYISNEEDLMLENEYYNALIEVKRLYPEDLEEVIVLSNEDIVSIEKELLVKTYPTLLLIDRNEIIAKIEGQNEKTTIINKISDYIETK